MKWDESFLSAFLDHTFTQDAGKEHSGFWLIARAQRPRLYAQILWEMFTTFVLYMPGTNLLRTILAEVNRKWPKWNDGQKIAVIRFLRKIDIKGEVTKELES